MNPLSIAGLGLGLIGGIGGLFGGGNKQLENLIKQDPTYQANPIAAQRLSLAQNLLNARMPGAAAAEANIYGSQAAQQANINRNATDSSSALALGAATQGQTNKSFENLNTQEDQDYQRRYGNLVGAQEGQIQEGDKVYQDQVRRFNDLAQIRGLQNRNQQQMWGNLSNLGFGLANFGIASGIGQTNGSNMGRSPAYARLPGLANPGVGYQSPGNTINFIDPNSYGNYTGT